MKSEIKQEAIMTKKIKSTYDKYVESLSSKERERFEQGYKDLLLSELLIALMEQDGISVRKLAKAAGISPSNIQGIRSGEKENITMRSFLRIMKALGCTLVATKGESSFPIDISLTKKK